MILRWQNHINFICIKNDVTWLFNENGLLPSSPGTFQGKSMERPVSVFDTNRISIEISRKESEHDIYSRMNNLSGWKST